MKDNKWLSLLTYVTGLANRELLLQNEYLAENRVLRARLPARLRLTNQNAPREMRSANDSDGRRCCGLPALPSQTPSWLGNGTSVACVPGSNRLESFASLVSNQRFLLILRARPHDPGRTS
jgi:hypothetical protein